MKLLFSAEKDIITFAVVRIVNAAVNRANGSALRLIVETFAFGALFRDYILQVHGNGSLRSIGVNLCSVCLSIATLYGCSVAETPFSSAFIDCIIGTFWFTSTAIDAL